MSATETVDEQEGPACRTAQTSHYRATERKQGVPACRTTKTASQIPASFDTALYSDEVYQGLL